MGYLGAPGAGDGRLRVPAIPARPTAGGYLRPGDVGDPGQPRRGRWRRLRVLGRPDDHYKVVVPDAITWEFDEIVAGGQNDRYAMTITLAPYGTLINDAKLSKTAGRWGWAVAPGAHSRAESSVSVGGWTFGVPSACKNKDWAFEFIQFATSKEWMRRSIERGNAPPRVSVLNQPDVQERFGWARCWRRR